MIVVTCTDIRGGADVVEVTAEVTPVPRSVLSEASEDMVLVRVDTISSTGMGNA